MTATLRPDTPEWNHPPLPVLKWDGRNWHGETLLQAWEKFWAKREFGISRGVAPRGRVEVRVESTENAQAPTAGQVAAFELLLAKQEEIKWTMLEALLPWYSNLRPDFRAFLGKEYKELMPRVAAPAQFLELIHPSCVHVLRREKEGMAFLGMQCSCSWDSEHQLGFMLHREKVERVGGATAAF